MSGSILFPEVGQSGFPLMQKTPILIFLLFALIWLRRFSILSPNCPLSFAPLMSGVNCSLDLEED